MQRTRLIEFLSVKFKEELGLSDATVLDVESEFAVYGLNSINAAKLSYSLSRAFDLEIAPKTIIENFSLAKLANYLLENKKIENIQGKQNITGESRSDIVGKDSLSGLPKVAENKGQLIRKIVDIFKSGSAVGSDFTTKLPDAGVVKKSTLHCSSAGAEFRVASDSIDFGFIFFSSDHQQVFEKKYDYVTEIARYADANGFKAIWIPERHFFEFGGVFPDPALLLANLAAATSSIRLRSGSVVLPLHHPTQVVESWSMLDNLSHGRVDMAFASGWNPNDFITSRETYCTLRETWFERMSQVERLWSGEAVEFYNGKQELVSIKTYPRPLQQHLAIWMAISGNPESFVEAGKRGYNILTMLASRPLEELAENIARYRQARMEHGFDPRTGVVSLMLHTYVHEHAEKVDSCVNQHYFAYIKSGLKGHVQAMNPQPGEAEINRIVEHSFHYQRKHSALFGDVEHCQTIVEQMQSIGVNEIACLVDFGIDEAQMYETLPYIAQLKNAVNKTANTPSRSLSDVSRLPMPAVARSPQEYAIVGMAGRYPAAKTLEDFWTNLLANRNCLSELSTERYDWRAIWGDPKTESGKTNIRHFGLIDDIYRFDATFFQISKREAELMDPHARLLLETVWQCIENAGYAPRTLNQSQTGLFLSFYNTEYGQLLDSLEIEKASEVFLGTSLSGTLKANRISYLLGLQGPSETYDTACSSSLVALHRAMQAIGAGDCEQALVAGVSLLLTPARVIHLSKMGILNERALCNPYSYPAYKEVIGEGVGALLIKPLSQALQARDYIYAVVSGSDVSHQGNSSGSLTMPSASSLAALMDKTYRKLALAPEQICYIEGHGSGNDSDLVELMAFQRCFASLPDRHTVWVGSVKSNIGFGEGSGGMAQLTKCALSLNHSVVPATINFEQADPNIDLAVSKLAVQTTNRELELDDGRIQHMSVLAYGLGGTNAHVVLRNHPAPKLNVDEIDASNTPYAMLFSAESEAVLAAYLQDFLKHLRRASVKRSYERLCGSAHHVLNALCQTLIARERSGRHRIVLLANSYEDLLIGLAAAVASEFHASIIRSSSASITESFEAIQASSPERNTLDRLATAWTNGAEVDWPDFYRHPSFQRLELPPVPFLGEELRLRPRLQRNAVTNVLHPLLQRNSSTIFDTKFTSTFDGNEFFLRDHKVQGNSVLPGVCHLEMARSAMANAFTTQVEIELTSVVWLRPIVLMNESLTLHISLSPSGDAAVTYDIYSLDQNGEETIYSQGRGHLLDIEHGPSVDLDSLLARCTANSLNVAQIYSRFSASDMQYGPGHQCIVALKVGIDDVGSPHALARLQIPKAHTLAQHADYYLHPGLLDSALQASIGLRLSHFDSSQAVPRLPFALESIRIYAAIPSSAYAWVRYSDNSRPGDAVEKLDISVCDERGKICAELRGFSSRTLSEKLTVERADTVLLRPIWEVVASANVKTNREVLGHHVLLVGDFTQKAYEALCSILSKQIVCEHINVANHSMAVCYAETFDRVFSKVQTLLESHPREPVLIQVVILESKETAGCYLSGLSGFLKTASKENPKLVSQCIQLTSKVEAERLTRIIEENADDLQFEEVRYRSERREVKRLVEISQSNLKKAELPWRDESITLITGGAGRLASIMARMIAKHTVRATVILTGRSALSAEKEKEIDALRTLGLTVDYQVADIGDRAAVQDLFAYVLNRYDRLTDIIHCAGTTKNNFILNKTTADFPPVLAPKVAGLINLDEASQAIALDHFVCFSSVASVLGNPGQADYAAANGFMDAYIHLRNELVGQGRRKRKILSINWPFWADGGLQVDSPTLAQWRRQGIMPLSTAAGLLAFNQCIQIDTDQVIVLSGNRPWIEKAMALPVVTLKKASQSKTVLGDDHGLLGKVQKALAQRVAAFLKISIDDIDFQSELSRYGLNSISLTEFGNQLNQHYDINLIPTIFFEYPTLQEFVEYLTREYGTRLAQVLREGSDTTRPEAMTSRSPIMAERGQPNRKRGGAIAKTWKTNTPDFNDPVAIIGMAGCFPQANDIDTYWKNLVAEKDCITEIPASRWDWRAIYGDPSRETNRTNIKWGGFIEGVDEFDPLFFGISPREAELMDPQQRLLMTYTWKLIEDAGYSAQSLSGTQTGIFIGTGSSGYGELIAQANLPIEGYSSTGIVPSVGPNRMSFILNLHGPSEPIETACSSSLVAIHRAVRAMQTGDCEMALVGGINTVITPWGHISFSKAGMLSEDGRCKTFSKAANGYVRGEGVGMLFLKKRSAAERDGDQIYGLIKGSSENHGGRANSLTAPNPKAQAELIKAAYVESRIDPRTVTYIEMHGSGTPLGDPIEINGLKLAFADLYAEPLFGEGGVSEKAHCGIGSVKTNIGHLELAAGVAGVIKVLLQMKHRTLVKSLHCEEINPYIQLQDTPFYIVNETQPWVTPQDSIGCALARRAGISSFGFGGANAHVIIEEYPATQSAPTTAAAVKLEPPALVVLSAKNKFQLKERARQLLSHLSSSNHLDCEYLACLAYTLQVGRDPMEHRLAFTAATIQELRETLTAYLEGETAVGEVTRCYLGEVKNNKESFAIFGDDDIVQSAVTKWIDQGDFAKLLDLWTKGLAVEWAKLYGKNAIYEKTKIKRISLPAYPFAKEKYWIQLNTSTQSITGRNRDDKNSAYELNEDGNSWDEEIEAEPAERLSSETHLLKWNWISSPLQIETAVERYSHEAHWVFLSSVFAGQLRAIEPPCSSINWQIFPTEATLDTWVAACGEQIFERVQALLRSVPKREVLLQVIVPGDTGHSGLALAISGLLRSAARENPKFKGQVIAIAGTASAADLVRIVVENANQSSSANEDIRYVDGLREVSRLIALHSVAPDDPPPDSSVAIRQQPWRDHGVYLVTGGTGGLGLIITDEIINRVREAKVILVGRSALDEEKQPLIKKWRSTNKNVEVEYYQADVTDEQAVRECVASVVERYGYLNGVIHCAGIKRDNFILNKTATEFNSVLAPKVTGTINLDRATAHLDLDCFLLFSSLSGVLGNAGQSDYAMANAFLDRYAVYRNDLTKQGERTGRTVAVAWPLWASGGMRVDEETHHEMLRQGFHPIESSVGIEMLYRAWASEEPHLVVLQSDRRVRDNLLAVREEVATSESTNFASETPHNESVLRNIVLRRLKGVFSRVTKIGIERIDELEPLESYGIDSIMIIKLNVKLADLFGDLSKTLFYEYQNLEQLCDYFMTEHREKCLRWTDISAKRVSVEVTPNKVNPKPERTAIQSELSGTILASVAAGAGTRKRSDIAIIGLAGKYPQAKTIDAFWQNLKAGKDCIVEIPAERWPLRGFYEADLESAIAHGKSYSKWGGFVDDFADFDPLFFNISPREASNMDPQERLFLQASWEVLEDAGYTKESLAKQHRGRVGVYAGVTKTGFELHGPQLRKEDERAYPYTSFSSVANRVSYILDLHGPSMPIDTMCSASLTAIHEACEHLARDECELAIAGGVNLYLHPSSYVILCSHRMLSRDGECKSFGEGGNGFVPGEGVGAVLLKPLNKAVEDRDHIYGVIKATSINHGGKTNGYTVPNPTSQRELVISALQKANIDPRTVSYVEAHGTGTELGDPIEITGLTQAFENRTQDKAYCAIGSVKSNIGHLEAAAGIAGLTKILLQMHHRTLVPSLHALTINPLIDLANTPFKLQRSLEEWQQPVIEIDGKKKKHPRIAGISSFGAGGANAHVIVAEYCAMSRDESQQLRSTPGKPALIILSARTEERLKQYAELLLTHISTGANTDADLLDIAYTLQVGREAMECRLAFTATTVADLSRTLRDYVEGRTDKGEATDCYRGEAKKNKEVLSILNVDDALHQAIATWIAQGKYAKLLELWAKGLVFDWERLYVDGAVYAAFKPQRVSLPTYPFLKERYWMKEIAVAEPRSSPLSAVSSSRNGVLLNSLLEAVLANKLDVDTAAEQARSITAVEE